MSISKFPISSWKRVRNRRGKLSVSCIVSDRWLSFQPPHHTKLDVGTPVTVDVMTDGDDGKSKKLCQLIVTIE